jgi:hypothetical protein
MVTVCAVVSEAAASAVAHHPWMRMGGSVRWGLDFGGFWNVVVVRLSRGPDGWVDAR